jgi:hypothetical protein
MLPRLIRLHPALVSDTYGFATRLVILVQCVQRKSNLTIAGHSLRNRSAFTQRVLEAGTRPKRFLDCKNYSRERRFDAGTTMMYKFLS